MLNRPKESKDDDGWDLTLATQVIEQGIKALGDKPPGWIGDHPVTTKYFESPPLIVRSNSKDFTQASSVSAYAGTVFFPQQAVAPTSPPTDLLQKPVPAVPPDSKGT